MNFLNLSTSCFIALFFLASFSSAAPQCQLASVDTCADDVAYLQCRFQEELQILEALGGNAAATPNPSDPPFFNDAGKEQCEEFVDRGFCVSQPTEMAAYCCKSYGALCSSQNETLPRPPDGNEVLFDDDNEAESFIDTNGGAAAITTRTPPTTGITTVAPTPSTSTAPQTTAAASASSSRSVAGINAPPTREELCDFVDSAAEMGAVVGKALRENFSFLLNDLVPAASVTQDTAEQRSTSEIVASGESSEWNVDPVIFDPSNNEEEQEVKLTAKERRMQRRNRSLQGTEEEVEGSATIPTTPPPAESVATNLRVELPLTDEPLLEGASESPLSSSDQDVLGILSMLGPGTADFIDSLVPDVNFAGLNYTRVEGDLIIYGSDIAQRLEKCNGCLQPLVETALDGAFQIPLTSDMTAAQKRRVIKKNDQAFIKATATDFTPRLIKALGMFTKELTVEQQQWLAARQGGSKDLSMDEFIGHSTSALKRVLQQDNLGGFMQNLLPIVGVVSRNMEAPTKVEAIKANGEKIYSETLECPAGPMYSDGDASGGIAGESSSFGAALEGLADDYDIADGRVVNDILADGTTTAAPSSEGRRLLMGTVEGLIGEDHLLESWREHRMKNMIAAAAATAAANDDEDGVSSNSPNHRHLQATNGGESAGAGEGVDGDESDGWLQGQPCLDRPSEFIASLQRLYGDLNCNDLISSVGCEPERFVLPLKSLIEACKSTWTLRCGPKSDSGITMDDLSDDIVNVLTRSECTTTEEFNLVTSTTTPTTTTSTTSTSTTPTTISNEPTTSAVFTSPPDQDSILPYTTKSASFHLSIASLTVLYVCITIVFMFV